MYKAFLNGELFFNTDSADEALQLGSASLDITAGQAGKFTFTVPPQNAAYDRFRKFADYVDLFRDSELIFSGRVYGEEKNFNLMQTVICEGMLAVLNDTVFRPINFNGTLAELVDMLINNHNSQVTEEKQVTVGTIEIEDEYVYRAFENHEKTMTRFQELIKSYGGYLYMTKTDDGLVLDWLAGMNEENPQTIDFGKNLIDLTQKSDGADIITVLIPLGAETEDENGNKNRVDIKSVNNNVDYITNVDALNEFGRIVGFMIWDDVTVPARLLTKATEYLNDVALSRVTINVTAADLADAGYEIENFRVGQRLKVTSTPHGLNGIWFDVQSQKLNLLNPASNRMSLGKTAPGYVGRQQNTVSRINQTLEIINKKYADNAQLRQTLTQYATQIEQNAEQIALKANRTELDAVSGRVTTVESAVAQTAEQLGIYFGTNGKITSWFTFDENKFSIGKADSSIHSEQDNQSYRFVDSSNNVLLEINPDGTVSQTVNVNRQVAFWEGNERYWAIRKGKYIQGRGTNLNDMWLGE